MKIRSIVRPVGAAMAGALMSVLVAGVAWGAPQSTTAWQGPEGNYEGVEWSYYMRISCPNYLPDPAWGIGAMVPSTYPVPQWNQSSLADPVEFNSVPYSRDESLYPAIQQVGFAWYNPLPSVARKWDMTFSWQSDRPSHKGGIPVECGRQCIIFGQICYNMIFTSTDIIGFAIPVGSDYEEERESPNSGECTGVMMEAYLWWYDAAGIYQEQIVRTWCVEEGEEWET